MSFRTLIPSILKCWYLTNLFKPFKLIMGLNPPEFFGITKIPLTKPFSLSDILLTAPLLKKDLASSSQM